MANKKFKPAATQTGPTGKNTPDKGNKPKGANDNHMIGSYPKKSFYKKMPEKQRGKGTWGGGVSRP